MCRKQSLDCVSGKGFLIQASMVFVGLLIIFIFQPLMAGMPFPPVDFLNCPCSPGMLRWLSGCEAWLVRRLSPKKGSIQMTAKSSGGGLPPAVYRLFKFVLRSPLHGNLSKNFLLITFTGCKSGKIGSLPVSFSQDGRILCILSHSCWWKNLCREAPISLRVGGKDVQSLPEPIVETKQAVAAGLMAHLHHSPYDAPYYGVTLDEKKNPRPHKVEAGVQTTVEIRGALC